MEHLFKLKKDGKTVGYERYIYCDQREGYVKGKSLVPQHSKDGININWEHLYLWELKTRPKGYWFEAHLDMDVYIEHDEKCLFVTKDKNGKDVFGDDEVDSMGGRCRVMWHEVMLQWCLWHIEGDYYFSSVTSKHDIELIEDKEDEQNP